MTKPTVPTYCSKPRLLAAFLKTASDIGSFRHHDLTRSIRHACCSRHPSAPSVLRRHRMSCNSPKLPRRTVLQFLSLSLIAPCQTLTVLAETQKKPSSTTTTATSPAASDIDPATNEPTITDRAYFDVSVASGSTQRIVIGLYGDLLPNVVDNFKKLALDGYSDTSVYRIVPGLTIQLGDVLHNGGKSGRPALHAGTPFIPDNYRVSHTIPGIVSMVRTPDGCVDSRFFIATRDGDSLYLDGRYAAFGRVVEGMNVLKLVERAGGEGFIRRPVRIVASGILQ